jgi:hypothetical protein
MKISTPQNKENRSLRICIQRTYYSVDDMLQCGGDGAQVC